MILHLKSKFQMFKKNCISDEQTGNGIPTTGYVAAISKMETRSWALLFFHTARL